MPEGNIEGASYTIEQRAKENRLVRKIVFIVTVVIAVLLLAAAGGGYYYVHNALQPVQPGSDEQVEVGIDYGSSVEDIARTLEKEGVINSALVFRYYVKYKNESGFQAGTYQLSPSMTIDEIIDQLKEGKIKKAVAFKMTIPEGLWMEQVAEIVAKKTNISKKQFLNKMKDRTYIKETYMKDYPFLKDVILKKGIHYPLEGYLFPATYSFTEDEPTMETIIDKMLDKTSQVLQEFDGQIAKSKMSVHQVLTLASIIEEEAPKKETRGKVSSVFHNRLKKDMPLQSNPTVDYAVHEHRVQISEKELKVDSPYNTYKYKGLPIGPICNPSKSSIAAAVNPENTDYLYFYARPNGDIVFAKTYEKFLQAKHKYEKEWEEYLQKQEKKQ
ncbi:MAG TPA: endolytic transglycosylase MltG [Bacillales bacterium]|nr:endolytic transglycosylase MltG [Bacillales bacterium]